jgi:hypothetical protein
MMMTVPEPMAWMLHMYEHRTVWQLAYLTAVEDLTLEPAIRPLEVPVSILAELARQDPSTGHKCMAFSMLEGIPVLFSMASKPARQPAHCC